MLYSTIGLLMLCFCVQLPLFTFLGVFCPFVLLQYPTATAQKYPNVKFNENPSFASTGVSYGQAER